MITAIIKRKKSKFSSLKPKTSVSVSVIICAKNDTENLHENLPFVLEQNYPDFEVIVMDDGSDIQFTMNHDRLRIISITKEEKVGSGKKYSLQKGIEAAKNKLILLTDADCKPVSKNWINEMAESATDTQKIVLGISPYIKENCLLNGLIEYETAQTALQYIGLAIIGNPYMSVGRNVLYEAALLKTKKWSAKELSIASGDDDLAIQSLATSQNTAVCLSEDSYTISDPKRSWKDFIKQKLRHYESGGLYKLSHRLLLGSYIFTKLLLYGCFFSLLIYSDYDKSIIFGIFSFYLITNTLGHLTLHHFLGLNNRWYFSFLNDILYCIFTVTLGLISQFKTVKNWK